MNLKSSPSARASLSILVSKSAAVLVMLVGASVLVGSLPVVVQHWHRPMPAAGRKIIA
ncbi:hypothetical protein [Rhodoferax sp.]|uniref:hypothetical protein n=1 Tax=Rhodoferax sp. TaxID=50421 RepID=UPI002730CC22|nr:hypothetical protein [Rhodoferax sp.]MDP1528010.1 hypothetical protein [Rhodoferax sp.]MDP1942635.1 hypothetical protein [Rhodoferax sp.]MDP2439934.1 hypothetical protein [Rhodoferax sp.]MDP3192621.1 hypothetical protein [Rhodoferax sp.]MDP3864919.1 hypothetical protein [Rhodoferax sp.]